MLSLASTRCRHILVVLVLFASVIGVCAGTNSWLYSTINLPQSVESPAPIQENEPIVVAIVDDGLRPSHEAVQGYLWRNPGEIPFNQKDDDGNGYIDDTSGWDLADADADFAPSATRAEAFSHGTHLASVLIELVEQVLGETATRAIQILPVKAISDYSERDYLTAGYAGVQYASQHGADIILCAWSQSRISPRDARILQSAAATGALIIAAAGNYGEDRETFPAAHPDVLAVAALNRSGQKLPNSSYGTFVDLAAPGEAIIGAHAVTDHAWKSRSGTSPAAALVAATAALVKWFNPSFSAHDLAMTLKAAATPHQLQHPLVMNRLGSGTLDIKASLSAGFLSQSSPRNNVTPHPKGFLRYERLENAPAVWNIQTRGEIVGTRFKLETVNGPIGNGILSFVSGTDEAHSRPFQKSFKLSDFLREQFVPGPNPTVLYHPSPNEAPLEWIIRYQSEPVHLPTRYCQGTTTLETPGHLEDGSGPEPYSPQSDCRWQINAPPGKWIAFEFETLDLETNIDKLYFFAGNHTNTQPFAILTGTTSPPTFTLPHHQALVWFVSDADNEFDGWSLNYRFISPPPPDTEPLTESSRHPTNPSASRSAPLGDDSQAF